MSEKIAENLYRSWQSSFISVPFLTFLYIKKNIFVFLISNVSKVYIFVLKEKGGDGG